MVLQRQQSAAYKEILQFLEGPDRQAPTDPLLLVGSAGTGKTTVIGAVLSSPVVKRAKKVAVCAPTNKAVW